MYLIFKTASLGAVFVCKSLVCKTRQRILKNMFRKSSGFTLIELLIVIAIIGILAATIVSRLQDARTDGLVVKTKAELNFIGKRAAVEENKALTYDVVCGSNSFTQATSVAEQIIAVETFTGESATCNSRTNAYAISIAISSTTHWCVDSTGTHVGRHNALAANEYICD
jgi:prepilin-type N-terminal cleavage/methylation domain-containing protein